LRKVKRKTLVKKLDAIFSEYIRRKHADKNGIVKCYTCNKKAYWKGEGMQNGHFISRSSRILRWREDNCRPQCYACNCMRYGQAYIFGANLNKEFGFNKAEELLIESKKIIKQSDQDLLDLIDDYKQKVESL
jgi:hypothetical protein|tara:strand:- start:4091 stop:4486 length:396 start_codon:yes stop_codon:yes gene_type:complete